MARGVLLECGPSCGCGPKCINRVAQKGLKIRLEVKNENHAKTWKMFPIFFCYMEGMRGTSMSVSTNQFPILSTHGPFSIRNEVGEYHCVPNTNDE